MYSGRTVQRGPENPPTQEQLAWSAAGREEEVWRRLLLLLLLLLLTALGHALHSLGQRLRRAPGSCWQLASQFVLALTASTSHVPPYTARHCVHDQSLNGAGRAARGFGGSWQAHCPPFWHGHLVGEALGGALGGAVREAGLTAVGAPVGAPVGTGAHWPRLVARAGADQPRRQSMHMEAAWTQLLAQL